MMRHNPRRGRATALATIAILLTGCSDDPGTRAGAGGDSPPPSPSGDLVQATRLTDVASADTLLPPGPYAMGFSSDQADAPMVVIDVPAGYLGRGDGFEISAEEGGFRHLDTWTVAEVAAQPCGGTAWVDPGPSVDGSVRAGVARLCVSLRPGLRHAVRGPRWLLSVRVRCGRRRRMASAVRDLGGAVCGRVRRSGAERGGTARVPSPRWPRCRGRFRRAL